LFNKGTKTHKPGTLAHVLKSALGSEMNIFNGSSIATYEIVKLLKAKSTGKSYSIGSNAKKGWEAFYAEQALSIARRTGPFVGHKEAHLFTRYMKKRSKVG
jgi:hypothetical protein